MSDEENAGHRSRLSSRYADSGLSSLQDYEIVELILTFAIPRKDTKPIAKELIRRHKSLSRLLHADRDQLSEVNGVGSRAALLLQLFRDVTSYCLQEKCEARPQVINHRDVEEYLRFTFGYRGDEFLVALFLDNGNNVIATEIMCEGTVNQCAVYPRAIVEKALRCKAASIIIAHNHPGGSMMPSEDDWRITERIAEIGWLLDMPLVDHVIVCSENAISLRSFARWPKKINSGG
jgi:DNA repair protein RadC